MRRRTFFGIVGAGAASAALPVFAGARPTLAERGRPEPGRPRGPNLDFLFAPLLGRVVSGGFRVDAISEVERGSVSITLARADGTRAQVQVFRRSPLSIGLATTRLLDLRWMNGGDGARVTPEAGGVAVMSLASRLRRIEGPLVRGGLAREQRAALRALETHEGRVARHGGFADVASGDEEQA